jgi:hypothetical protein
MTVSDILIFHDSIKIEPERYQFISVFIPYQRVYFNKDFLGKLQQDQLYCPYLLEIAR